jgi:hypothetical protein
VRDATLVQLQRPARYPRQIEHATWRPGGARRALADALRGLVALTSEPDLSVGRRRARAAGLADDRGVREFNGRGRRWSAGSLI